MNISTIKTLILTLLSAFSLHAQIPVIDSIFMGPGYANQIYYSLDSGDVGSQIAANWHIAVSVQPSIPPTQTLQGTTIRINGGYGVEVYKVSDTDSTGFTTLNSVNNIGNWQLLRDKYNTWDEGCLNQTRNMSNPFDYGWGIYQGNPTYNVVGDSIYVVKFGSSSYKKMWVKQLKFDTTWNIIVSDLDNSNAQNFSFSKATPAYQGKNFVYLNLTNGDVNNDEPSSGWDLLFGKYISEVAPGTFYPVTGVLTNKPVQSVKAYPVDINTVSYTSYESSLNLNISNIGYDWKVFSSGEFIMEDSLVYYVKAGNGNVFRLRFLDFRAADGMAKFELIPVSSGVGFTTVNATNNLMIFPNPSNDLVNVHSTSQLKSIQLFDISGRLLMDNSDITHNNFTLSLSALQSGLYMIRVATTEYITTQKIIKK